MVTKFAYIRGRSLERGSCLRWEISEQVANQTVGSVQHLLQCPPGTQARSRSSVKKR